MSRTGMKIDEVRDQESTGRTRNNNDNEVRNPREEHATMTIKETSTPQGAQLHMHNTGTSAQTQGGLETLAKTQHRKRNQV